jgi:hypothetical protein
VRQVQMVLEIGRKLRRIELVNVFIHVKSKLHTCCIMDSGIHKIHQLFSTPIAIFFHLTYPLSEADSRQSAVSIVS